MNFSDLLTPANVMLVVVLFIQIYKLARPMLMKTESGKDVVDTVDRAWKFVYDKAGPIYLIVEAMAMKGLIDKTDKSARFLGELREEAWKHRIRLSPEQESEAMFIARTNAAADHQPGVALPELVSVAEIRPQNPLMALPVTPK